MIAALSYFRTEDHTQKTGVADVSPVEEASIPNAEVDKFIAKMETTFANGNGLIIGETHGRVGTYKLLNHPKVQQWLMEKTEKCKNDGKVFLSNLYIELPESYKGEEDFETFGDLCFEFNKNDATRRPDIENKMGLFLLQKTNNASVHHVNEQLKFFNFIHSLNAKLTPSDNFVTKDNLQEVATKLIKGIYKRNKVTADVIANQQKNNPSACFIQISGSMHLEDRKIFSRMKSIESRLDKINQSKNYAESIHIMEDLNEYKFKKTKIKTDRYEFNRLDAIDYNKLIVNEAAYFTEILNRYPNLKDPKRMTFDEEKIIIKDIDDNFHKYIDVNLKQECINKLYGTNDLLPAFKLIIENDLDNIAHVEFVKKFNTKFKFILGTTESKETLIYNLHRDSPKINRDEAQN